MSATERNKKGQAIRLGQVHRSDVEDISNCIIGMYHGHYDTELSDYKDLMEFCLSLMHLTGASDKNPAVENLTKALADITVKRARAKYLITGDSK